MDVLNIADAEEGQLRSVSHRRISDEVEDGRGRCIRYDVGLESISDDEFVIWRESFLGSEELSWIAGFDGLQLVARMNSVLTYSLVVAGGPGTCRAQPKTGGVPDSCRRHGRVFGRRERRPLGLGQSGLRAIYKCRLRWQASRIPPALLVESPSLGPGWPALSWSEPSVWSMGLLQANDWLAKWIGLDGGDETRSEDPSRTRLPARMLRRESEARHQIKRATVYLSGLGFFDLHINGAVVGDHIMDPGLTEYSKRVLYVTVDVTDQPNPGANALGVVLGNGRFFAPRGDGHPVKFKTYGYPKLLCSSKLSTQMGHASNWLVTAIGESQLTDRFAPIMNTTARNTTLARP